MRRLAIIVVLWLGFNVLAAGCMARADAHENHELGAVAVCNWENFEQYGHDGFNWRWIACNHTLHNHRQFRHGLGTPGHTVDRYKREAAAFRAYCGID